METEVKLTKLAGCAGCGAKVGAGTLVHLLEGFRTHTDPRLIVGYDKSDDASVYVLDENTALVQTTDFFPPIVDDPFLYGQIAAANALFCAAATTRPMRPARSSRAVTPFRVPSRSTDWRFRASCIRKRCSPTAAQSRGTC